MHWLKPTLLAEVAFAEMTKDGSVRHAVFHGLRDDKPAKEITEELPKTVNTSASKNISLENRRCKIHGEEEIRRRET